MKMYTFPRSDNAASLDIKPDRQWISPSLDATIVRLCGFLLAWTAGAGAAAFLVMGG